MILNPTKLNIGERVHCVYTASGSRKYERVLQIIQIKTDYVIADILNDPDSNLKRTSFFFSDYEFYTYTRSCHRCSKTDLKI